MDRSARFVEDRNRQAGVIVEMSTPKRRRKFFAVLDRFLVKRKPQLEPIERVNSDLHIEKERSQ
jgi:hypothetical protein